MLLADQLSKRLESERVRPQGPAGQLPQPRLTKLERRVMEVFWDCGKASIREIMEVFPEPRAYTTIQTIVYRLELKKAVRRVRKVSNAHIFEPIVFPPGFDGQAEGARDRLLEEILNFFGGPQAMLAQLIESGKLTLEDVRGLEETLEGR
jgi:BlaI family transcriptional regulator, penicillinase repressor